MITVNIEINLHQHKKKKEKKEVNDVEGFANLILNTYR